MANAMRYLMLAWAILLAGCGTNVFRAGFNEKSEGDNLGTNNPIYMPPENPSGDRISGNHVSTQNVRFSTNLNVGAGTTLVLEPITPASNTNAVLTFESTDVSSSHDRYTMAWSGKKKGNLVMDCEFGWAIDQTGGPAVQYRPTVRFADGKLYAFNANGQPLELGALPNDVEHRVFVSARPNTDSWYVSVKNSITGELATQKTLGLADFDGTDNLRVRCAYQGTAATDSNYYLFDKMEFKSRKS